MAIGTIQKSILTDIANAIRVQNGGTDTYKPSEMAAAVLALDGSKAGTPFQAAAASGTGVISDAVFEGIADAIRTQNGLSETYKPSEMAPAILALVWDVGIKMRAILLADGTLEFNYRDGRSSDVPGAVILDAWEVDAEGYVSASARPWDDVKLDVRRVVLDGDFSQGGLTDASYFFNGFDSMTEVRGFEQLASVPTFDQCFSGCGKLESVYATGYAATVEQTGSLALFGCDLLAGAAGYVPPYGEDIDGHLSYGEDGILTDPDADAREWVACTLYADGELVISRDAAPHAGRAVACAGHLCATARYQAIGVAPWRGCAQPMLRATFAADLVALSYVNFNYWFHSETDMAEVAGIGNLPGIRHMDFAFYGCDSLVSIDLSGLDPSQLESMDYAFASCAALTTIWADADWALPAGVSGFATFYGCKALVGGAGTVFSSSRYSGTYMRIDGGVASPGYLTAKA